MRPFIAAACAGLLFVSVVSRAAADDAAIEFQSDVEYGRTEAGPLLLNLAKPREPGKGRPAIVCIHGGAWSGGTRALHDGDVRQLAARGYVAVTVEYRLLPEHKFPAQIEDCKCAVRWMRAHAAELGIDGQRIGALGSSAGAHLALLLGVMDSADGLEGTGGWADQSSKVQAAVSFAGPTDLTVVFPEAAIKIIESFVGGSRAEKQPLIRQASPVIYVDKGDGPLLLFHGTNDEIVPMDQAVRMAAAMGKSGVPGRIELIAGASHGWAPPEHARVMGVVFKFFDDQLKSPRP